MLSEAANYLLQLTRGGSYGPDRDALKHRVYDSRYFGTTISDNSLFNQPIGSPWRSGLKTRTETNMRDTGKLPARQTMIFTRMGVSFKFFDALGAATADLLVKSALQILDSSVFEIKIDGREWDYQIHGSEFLPAIHSAGTAQAANPVRGAGDFIASGWTRLDPTPIVVDDQVGFGVDHYLGNPDSNVVTILNAACTALNTALAVMTVSLEGLLTRAK